MEKRTFKDTKLGTPQGGIISPLLANIYLHELDRYMERYTSLSPNEKAKRRKEKQGNFTYTRYADDFVVLCNGPKRQAEAMRKELYEFLNQKLRLELSKEKTRITHINDGFIFLGFHLQRGLGGKGTMTIKVTIPDEARTKLKDKLKQALSPTSHQDSMVVKITAINRIVRGWCQYYQYSSKVGEPFSDIDHFLFWEMAHWIGRKFKLSMPEVMLKYEKDNSFALGKLRLLKAIEFKAKTYRQRFFKPNPYLTVEKKLMREELPQKSLWLGYEPRPGHADLRLVALERDNYTCQICGNFVTTKTAEVDHIRPVRRFKRPIDANRLDNYQTLCIPCHATKTKVDRHAESRMR
jgi:hypothetical protein